MSRCAGVTAISMTGLVEPSWPETARPACLVR